MRADDAVRCADFQEQAAAYALGALEPAEREAVEAHARACPSCTDELADLQRVAAQLALSLPQHAPPAALGERVLAAAHPVAALLAAPEANEPMPFSPPGQPPRPVVGAARSGPIRRTPWLPLAVLAAALAALLWGASLQDQLSTTRQQLAETNGQLERIRNAYSTVVEVLASSDTQVRDLQPREGAPAAQGKLWVDPASGRGMMMARDLPPLPEGQAYQVWLSTPQGRLSAGFLRPYDDGIYYVVLQAPGNLTDYETVGVTREPATGSPGPTGPRIIGGEI